ncbi:MAG TPA: hypothetical protein VM263_02465 [Acidimicrobiales bacterium]|jgi:hypothetical protein|nr:hypothetical protein [Acidimicrobiales bacterium]
MGRTRSTGTDLPARERATGRVRRAVAASVLGSMLVGCGGDDEVASTSTTSTSSTTTTTSTTISPPSTTTTDRSLRLTQSCTHEERGIRVVVPYPEGWHVNGGEATACSAFDPEPISLRAGTEFPLDLAVVVRVEPVELARATGSSGLRIEDQRQLQVDGRQAVRLVARSTGEPMAPEGARSVRYVVDAGPERSIIATTWDVEGNDFETAVAALDRMAEGFDIERRPG